jgi:hypothetical protein
VFKSKRIPLTSEQKDLVLSVLRIYGFGEGSIMEPLRARIVADEALIGSQEAVIKALLARAAEITGPDDAEALRALIKRRWS